MNSVRSNRLVDTRTARAVLALSLLVGSASFAAESSRSILWDDAHNASHTLANNYTTFVDILRAEGYLVDPLQTELDRSMLANYDVFVTVDPNQAFTVNEVAAIIEFVADGGGLWVMGEWYPRWDGQDNLNAFLETLGITLNEDAIRTDQSIGLEPHPVSQGVERIQVWDTATLAITGSAVPIGLIGPDIILASNNYGCGRVLVVGDEIVVSHSHNGWLYREDNLTYGLNAAAWLSAAGCYTTFDIDIKPGLSNKVNPYARGVIPVAILGSDTFDVSGIDVTTLVFGPGGAPIAHLNGHLQDVNYDGIMDLVTHYRTRDTGIACGDESVTLTGETLDGQPIQGSDSIQTVGCRVTRRPAIWMKDVDRLGKPRSDGPVNIKRE